MTQDEIIEMASKSGFFVKDNDAYSPSVQEDHELTPFLVAFAHLVAAKATEEANARANASWTLMCKKMVAIEREALAQPERTWVGLTEEEKSELWEISRAAWPRYVTYASLAEAKLKQKNT